MTQEQQILTLSAAVVDRFLPEFSSLSSIEVGICASERLPGVATVAAVLSYCGNSFLQWQDGQWRSVHGWQDMRRIRMPQPVGERWFANCDVPDLELFPRRYPGVRTVRFQAGLGLQATHLGLWMLSGLRRARLLPSLSRFAPALRRGGQWLERFGDGASGMFVHVCGLDPAGAERKRGWYLVAENNEGQHIPCLAAVAVARKLACGRLRQRIQIPAPSNPAGCGLAWTLKTTAVISSC